MKNLFKAILASYDYDLKKRTDVVDLVSFLSSLNPVKIDLPLIRIGAERDSGYVLPDDLDGIKECFSPGVEYDASFELEIFNAKGIHSHLADASVDGPPYECLGFDFIKKFIGYGDDSYQTLEEWIRESRQDQSCDMLLQMDIEGSEYEVLMDTSNETLKNFRIMCIEFHGFDRLLDRDYFIYVKNIFKKLSKSFHICHIHPNNVSDPVSYKGMSIPPTLEFTFIRKDRVDIKGYMTQDSYPLNLDVRNVDYKKDLVLSKAFFK
jgi:hypothetical protein